MNPTDALLTIRGLTKSFPGLRALDQVDLEVHRGEIVAVLGQNGSGKSTLVKILAGVFRADAGTVTLHGGASPDGAAEIPQVTRGSKSSNVGLHVIHQEHGLVETLSTVENLALGRERGRLRPVRRRRETRHALRLIARFGISIDVDCPVRELTPAQRSIVAIARALDGWTSRDNVLVLDEPTASLHGSEVRVLFGAVRRLADAGAGIVFISHRLDEVRELADRLVVLRDGRLAAVRDARGLTTESIVELITGVATAVPSSAPSHVAAAEGAQRGAAPALSARGLRGGALRHLDLDLKPGEVVGIAGMVGSGRDDVAALLFGARRHRGGTIRVAGKPVTKPSPHWAVRHGLGYIPADRRTLGAILGLNLGENVVLPELRSVSAARVHLRHGRERDQVSQWIHRLDVRPRRPDYRFEFFSGGNQQKAVLAKWLRTRPSVLLVDEPTQGVDIGASRDIRALLASTPGDMAVLITSSDNADLVGVCTRVLVMRDGLVRAELHGPDITDHRITQECLGDASCEPEDSNPYRPQTRLEADSV